MMGTGQLCSMERDRKTAKERKGTGRTVPTLEAVQLESSGVYKRYGKFGLRKTRLPGRAQQSKLKFNSKHMVISNQLCYSRTLQPWWGNVWEIRELGMETKPEAQRVSWGQTLTSASARGSCQKCQILGLCCRANSESQPQVGHGVMFCVGQDWLAF